MHLPIRNVSGKKKIIGQQILTEMKDIIFPQLK